MDQKRLFLAIAISIAIIVGFQLVMPHPQRTAPHPQSTATTETVQPAKPSDTIGVTPMDAGAAAAVPAQEAPRVKIAAPRVEGTINLLGARIDDLVLRDYRETIEPNSPLVRLLEPRGEKQPYFAQFGWSAAPGSNVKLPGNDTEWKASGDTLSAGHPVTLSWDNGEGQTFEITFSVDDNYMFTAQQRVHNAGTAPVEVYPWSRIRREYTPQTAGYYILHEGLIGWVGDQLREVKYAAARTEGEKNNGIALDAQTMGGWAGFTDKYWLTALVPDAAVPQIARFRHNTGPNGDQYQVDYATKDALQVAPNGEATLATRMFAGAKEVHLLNHYQNNENVSHLSYAVDWGWFWFITKPFFYCLDWLNAALGNFGLAILVFTICVKALFFPLANKSYRSMSKMKLLGPKMQALREQYKDDPAKQQQAMMQLYKAEKVNPASGCLPMVIQIPVFFSLYKVIFITIEMRHAPFFGWIRDLSAIDPTNIFNLFGLLPFDPTLISPALHLGAWPLIMGLTMFFQQKLNPPPPDPVQARVFQFMPLIFTFMLARFPAGLVIYWSWNNLLTIGQQWLIMRQTRLARPGLART
jgi:YidC/Oxa1 family membrane protein insertase